MKNGLNLWVVSDNLRKGACAHGQVAREGYAPFGNATTKDPLELSIQIDAAVKKVRRDDWRGNQPKENEIKRALNDVLQDVAAVESIFNIIKQHKEY